MSAAAGLRIAVIGDVGGHLDALRAQLASLGVPDGTGPLPPDLRVIQVGDLVHRGPDSAGVVALVDGYLRRQPQGWLQLVGNHELFYLRRRQFSWDSRVPRATATVLRDWWRRGMMQVAASFRAGDEQFLVTHAGLTHAFWAQVLGAPGHAGAAARALNRLAATQPRTVFRSGSLVHGREPTPLAGPVWAAAGDEVVAGWLAHPLPFSQLHGHTSVVHWESGRWYLQPEARHLVELDAERRHTAIALSGGRLIGVDAGDAALRRGEGRAWVTTGVLD
ncbi:metallophosphoesterase [Micropruina sonneratiae]|uniref:metallophosphoesterase n=1 Tax=Micropruina sonneratiae TaxID=2986940 RepID=UPI002226DD11|nr:metallophosphoesterase [Micropruina sp. KQZ13P-5]MCW3156926.1 metallophosphoesterase [Micropruina sp. KQZ13P-5]